MQHNTCWTRTLIQTTGGKDDPHTVKSATKLTYLCISLNDYVYDKMKNEKYRTVETVSKSNRHVVELEAKLIALTYMYMTTHFPGLVQSLQYKVVGLT